MKKLSFFLVTFFVAALSANAQVYKGNKTSVDFFSYTPVENIAAKDTIATVILNAKTGDVYLTLPIKGFVFPNALMQEHFNENYMETDLAGPKDANGKVTYPNQRATFKGKINEVVDYTKDGSYPVTITGVLTIHGVPQTRTISGTMVVKGRTATMDSKFEVPLADHKITVPEAVGTKIADKIAVTLHCELVNTAKQ